MSNLQKSKRFDLIDKFKDTSRYLDDIFTINNPERYVMITQKMCPIRAEISTHKHLGKFIFYLYGQPQLVSDKVASICCLILEILGQK